MPESLAGSVHTHDASSRKRDDREAARAAAKRAEKVKAAKAKARDGGAGADALRGRRRLLGKAEKKSAHHAKPAPAPAPPAVPSKLTAASLDAATLARVRAAVALDLQLYDACLELFERQLAVYERLFSK